MKVKVFYLLAATAIIFSSCKNENNQQETNDNLLYTAKNWKADTDALGSSYTPKDIAIADSAIEVEFTLKKKGENEIVFIELICSLKESLKEYSGMSIRYKCDSNLVVKLSQSDFGKDGDQSYAHYQFVVPASDVYTTKTLKFSDFTQPGWTPEASQGFPMKLENVDAIYLTPNVHEDFGGSSALGVMELYLHK